MKTTLATLAWVLSAGLNYWGAIELQVLQEEVRALSTFLHANLEEDEPVSYTFYSNIYTNNTKNKCDNI